MLQQFVNLAGMIDSRPVKMRRSDIGIIPASNDLMNKGTMSQYKYCFKKHFLTKRCRPEIQPIVALSTTRGEMILAGTKW